MNDKTFSHIIFRALAATIVFSAVAKGAVNVWSITIVEWVVLTILLLWLWRMNNHSGWALQPNGLDRPIWLFLGLAVISWFFSIYQYDSMIELFRVITYVAVYYLVVHHFNWPIQVWFFAFIVTLATFLSVLGIGQYFFDLNHDWWSNPHYLSATYVSHAHFAGLLEMAIPLSAGLLVGLNRDEVAGPFHLIKWRLLLAAALGIMLAAFILTQSRGAWIVLAATSIVLCLLLIKQKALPKWGFGVFMLGLALFIAFIGFAEDPVAARMHTIHMGDSSFLVTRLAAWQQSLGIIKDYFGTGTGPGTFAWIFPQYRPEGFGFRLYFLHNDYLQAVVEMGAFIIPVFMWGIFVVLKESFGRRKHEFHLKKAMRLACGVGILSLMLHGLVDFNFHIPANMLVFVCLVGIVLREKRKPNYQ